MSKILSRYAETGSYKPGPVGHNGRKQSKVSHQSSYSDEPSTTEESDESKSKLSPIPHIRFSFMFDL